MLNHRLGKYLHFNRRERWGLVSGVLVLAGLFWIASRFPEKGSVAAAPHWRADSPLNTGERKTAEPATGRPEGKPLGPFDPNRIGESDWIEMGVPVRTARTILNYLGKGGRFREAADLGKIWGMRKSDLDRLLPYVRILRSDPESLRPTPYVATPFAVSVKMRPAEKKPIDINRSDSASWESLPGIGPTYARRILRLRDRLGGFVRVDQVAETYQLPDSVYQRIRPFLAEQAMEPYRKISINRITLDSLGRHPYFNYSMARLVVRYREQHGPFQKLEDLLDIQQMDSVRWLRIRPYLTLE